MGIQEQGEMAQLVVIGPSLRLDTSTIEYFHFLWCQKPKERISSQRFVLLAN